MLRAALLVLAVAVVACQAASADDDRVLQVYNNVVVGDYDTAVSKTKALQRDGKGYLISQVVKNLVKDRVRNIMEYAYKLWILDAKNIVRERFPVQFRMILGENVVKLIFYRDNLAMKLGEAVDNLGDRVAYGDVDDKSSDRVSWKFVPLWEDKRVYFKIMNVQRSQFLKLAVEADTDGEHKAYGDSGTGTFRHQWYLQPAILYGETVFFIVNREYHQSLKLGRALDSAGDRQVWSHKGGVDETPQLFGWHVHAF